MTTPNQSNLLFIVILALVLVFFLPMLLSRQGNATLLDSLFGKLGKRAPLGIPVQKKREPHLSNGTKGELTELASALLNLCRRKKWCLVYPGTIVDDGKLACLLALVVTPGKVIGVNCFGYGGTIYAESNKPWRQHINGADQTFPDPVAASQAQQALVRRAMDKNGLTGIPLEVVSVFTNSHVTLMAPSSLRCMTRGQFLDELKNSAPSGDIDPASVGRQLSAMVKRVIPQKGKKHR